MQNNFLDDLKKHKWQLLVFPVSAALLALLISIFQPKEYVSQASLLPSNSKLMDKQSLFNNNIQELYSAYGNAEDLDRLFATMRSGAVVNFVADSLNLAQHYKLQGKKNAKQLAQKKLEKQIKLLRTEYGELQLRAWDEDPAMAEKIAGLMIWKTQAQFDNMFRNYFSRSISNLEKELSTADTLRQKPELDAIRSRLAEYKVTVLNPPPAFFEMEKPVQSLSPDKPKILLNILVALSAALLTSIAWIAAKRSA